MGGRRAGRGRYLHLQRTLRDSRSERVVFVSHCLLNQNTRYLGGAVCPGVVAAAIEPYIADGSGIVQLPCPEQRTWGGVRKTRLLWWLDHPWAAPVGRLLLPAAESYLRRRYRRLARGVVDDIEDHLVSGCEVRGVVGVAGSPSCGVHTTLDLSTALAAVARASRASVSADWLRDTVVGPAQRPGSGLFVQALHAELARRGLRVPVTESVL